MLADFVLLQPITREIVKQVYALQRESATPYSAFLVVVTDRFKSVKVGCMSRAGFRRVGWRIESTDFGCRKQMISFTPKKELYSADRRRVVARAWNGPEEIVQHVNEAMCRDVDKTQLLVAFKP